MADDYTPAAVAYVRFVLAELGISPSALARRAGVATTTLTRPLNDPHHKFGFSLKTLQKLRDATGINPDFFASDPTISELTRHTVFGSDQLYDTPDRAGPSSTGIPSVTPCAGEIAAGVWIEMGVMPFAERAPIMLRSSFGDSGDNFYYVVTDRSLNKIAQPNELLFVYRPDPDIRLPLDDQLVIIERRSEDGLLTEVTARRIRTTESGWEFRFESDDPRFASSKLTTPSGNPGRKLFVVGIVDYVVREVGSSS